MMKKLALILLFGVLGVGVYGQTIKTLGYTTNGQVVANTGTNVLTFTNAVNVASFEVKQGTNTYFYAADDVVESYVNFSVYEAIAFSGSNSALGTRINLGFSTNLNTLWTATNSSNARSAVGLGWSALTNTNASNFRNAIDLGTNDSPRFGAVNVIDTIFSFGQTLISGGSISVNNSNSQGVSMNPAGYTAGSINIVSGVGGNTNAITFSAAAAAATRTNLGIGNGITTNRTFVSYNGTNYTTNSVTISNGIITGWTQ
jgi:hypothetical protein